MKKKVKKSIGIKPDLITIYAPPKKQKDTKAH